jgi:site-specific DNA-methyltransferase (adenine-specific)
MTAEQLIIDDTTPAFVHGDSALYEADCLPWLRNQPDNSIHAVVTDPPYGIVEYTKKEQAKLLSGRGGVWRIPPILNGYRRSPIPRFTTLGKKDRLAIGSYFEEWALALLPVLVPGAHVMMASNPLLSHIVSTALAESGFERRGEIIRLVMTMRGGDRPKNAHDEFVGVTVMPRSMWEPWLLFRKPTDGNVADNLRKWGTGGLRRLGEDRPFGDVIQSAPTHAAEKKIAPHPSLKPQSFLREILRASLPLGKGVVLDPFAGSGSTLAAAEAVGYQSIGVEYDAAYISLASSAIPSLAAFPVRER